MRIVTVEVAGQTYEVRPLTINESAKWRKRLEGPFAQVAAGLKEVSLLEATNLVGIGDVLNTFSGVLLQSPDTVRELLFAYAPPLEADRERIEAEGYDDEIINAFMSVLGLAYPLGRLTDFLNGGKTQATSRS